ncbi:MAG: glycosyltransferase [Planctomycetota bacterium]
MRICFVVHGYPPEERTGVENYTECLARELAQRGHEVHVFTRRTDPSLGHLATRVERRAGTTVHWLATNEHPRNEREALDLPGAAEEFGLFLDDVRPEVVHFQHVLKLGVGLLRAAHTRSIPVVYTAHDFYAICHRFTLLRPDLENCGARQDPDACARCDRAIELLHGFGLEDYQLGMFEHELTDEQQSALSAVLEGAGEADAIEASQELRRELGAARIDAFRCVDLLISPSQHLADVLVEGGFDAERMEVLAYGLELDELKVLAPPPPLEGRKLRLAFFGGLSKHKGVQDLLAAFDGLADVCELTVHGYTSDAGHRARLEEAAARVGARMAGAYHRDAVAGLYASVDAVVVPSIWAENQPLVIREALAARRPVVTANYGAMPESVTDEVNGLLFEARNVESLRTTLRRLATEPGLFERLSGAATEVKDVATQATELEVRYAALVAERDQRLARERDRLPRSLGEPAARFQRLSDLPTDELIRRAVGGITALSSHFELGADRGPWSAGLMLELDAASELRAESRRNAWLEAEHAERSRELSWRQGAMEDLTRAREYLAGEVKAAQAEATWYRESLERAHENLERASESLTRAETGRDELVASFERLTERLEELGADVSGLRQALAWARQDLAAMPKLALAAVEAQTRLLEDELEPLQAAAGDDSRPEESPIHSYRRAFEQIHRELHWRRDEMQAVSARVNRGWLGRLLRRTGLGNRVRGWTQGGAS